MFASQNEDYNVTVSLLRDGTGHQGDLRDLARQTAEREYGKLRREGEVPADFHIEPAFHGPNVYFRGISAEREAEIQYGVLLCGANLYDLRIRIPRQGSPAGNPIRQSLFQVVASCRCRTSAAAVEGIKQLGLSVVVFGDLGLTGAVVPGTTVRKFNGGAEIAFPASSQCTVRMSNKRDLSREQGDYRKLVEKWVAESEPSQKVRKLKPSWRHMDGTSYYAARRGDRETNRWKGIVLVDDVALDFEVTVKSSRVSDEAADNVGWLLLSLSKVCDPARPIPATQTRER